MQAAILAIGTELTTGQVLNRNSTWIAERMITAGHEVIEHAVVPDSRPLIRGTLDRLGASVKTLVVTGGLGPTSDDFTREVIAEWAGLPLEFDAESWTHIETRLMSLGARVAPSNRQQCYFPKGAHIVPNDQGTARAFWFDRGGARVYVLPGPPREVAAVWDAGIGADIAARAPKGTAATLWTWQTLGVSEAEIGERTETALAGSQLTVGYRAHRPFVEVKLWIPAARDSETARWKDRVENALGSAIASRQGADLATEFLREAAARSAQLDFWDLSTGGILAERVSTALRAWPAADRPEARVLAEFESGPTSGLSSAASCEERIVAALSDSDPDGLAFAIAGPSSDAQLFFGQTRGNGPPRVIAEKAPWTGRAALERVQRYQVERALLIWRAGLDIAH